MYVHISDVLLNSISVYSVAYSTSPFKYLLDIIKLIWFTKNKLMDSHIYPPTPECISYTQLFLISKLSYHFFFLQVKSVESPLAFLFLFINLLLNLITFTFEIYLVADAFSLFFSLLTHSSLGTVNSSIGRVILQIPITLPPPLKF